MRGDSLAPRQAGRDDNTGDSCFHQRAFAAELLFDIGDGEPAACQVCEAVQIQGDGLSFARRDIVCDMIPILIADAVGERITQTARDSGRCCGLVAEQS